MGFQNCSILGLHFGLRDWLPNVSGSRDNLGRKITLKLRHNTLKRPCFKVLKILIAWWKFVIFVKETILFSKLALKICMRLSVDIFFNLLSFRISLIKIVKMKIVYL